MSKVLHDQSIILSAFIVMLLTHLDKADQHRGSVVRLRQILFTELKKGNRDLVVMADEAYDEIKMKYVDKQLELDLGITIEAMSFKLEDAMIQTYGEHILDIISRACLKVTLDGLNQKQRTDSYMVANDLIDSLRSIVHKYKDK